MALFYFVRHGETEWNAENRVCGRTDVPVSEAGRRQAARLAERLRALPVGALYSSPLQRALETANIIGEAAGLKPTVDESLIELDYGAWEGKTFAEIMEQDTATYRAWDADPGAMAPPGGETGRQALARVVPFLDSRAAEHPQGHVVIVSHKTICRLVICHALGLAPSEYRRRFPMQNGALNIIQPWEQGWRVVLLNDTSHLAAPHPDSASMNADF